MFITCNPKEMGMTGRDGQRDQGVDGVTEAVRTTTDLLARVTLIGIDFADVQTVLHRDGLAGAGDGGLAAFGTGEASGPDRAVKAELRIMTFFARGIVTEGRDSKRGEPRRSPCEGGAAIIFGPEP
jgi:hypothetical protein